MLAVGVLVAALLALAWNYAARKIRPPKSEKDGYPVVLAFTKPDMVEGATYSYHLLKITALENGRRNLEIELSKPISEQGLKTLALRLKKMDRGQSPHLFIGYYLPQMKHNGSYWATTNFAPELTVHILGPKPGTTRGAPSKP